MLSKIPKTSPVVLFRNFDKLTSKINSEIEICKKYFVTTESRMNVTGGDLIVGRYSVLPYFQELERDLEYKGAKLINNFREHSYVADLKNWAYKSYDKNYQTLFEYTPQTWFSLEDVPDDSGPLIVKGQTNSKKERWSTHMFANTKKEAVEVYSKLRDDRFFDNQEIYFRKFVNFKKFFNDPITNQPITNEFRFFYYQKHLLCSGFYWSNYVDELDNIPNPSIVPKSFLNKIVDIVSNNINFFVIDVAELENGDFQVVELNDGMCSGLSECDPHELYKNLKYHLWDKNFKQAP